MLKWEESVDYLMADYAELASLLDELRAVDTAENVDYEKRGRLIFETAHVAQLCDFEVGIRIDDEEPEWPAIYIELPNGQISWHMKQHSKPFDGHDHKEKWARMREFTA